MKKLLSVLLAAAVLLCGLAVLAEQDESKEEDRFSALRIRVPTVPPVEVPEIPEIEVPSLVRKMLLSRKNKSASTDNKTTYNPIIVLICVSALLGLGIRRKK